MDKQAFEQHLLEEHGQTKFAQYLKEFIYGGNDGIVTTFAVVAGFSGANIGAGALNFSLVSVLLFGLANLVADGAAMGLGNLLSIRSHKKVYANAVDKELHEIKHSYDYEIAETEFILKEQGFSKEDSTQITALFSKNPKFWSGFMVQHELELSNPEHDNEYLSGLATFAAFVFFGFFPLIPYFFSGPNETLFLNSIFCSLFAFFLLALLRTFLAKERFLQCLFEVVIIGSVAASFAYFVGMFFKV
ncbi:GMP synthase [Candidatus Marinamargulisbacteria bacterium SCGC AG-414-C22]|nr:GMP synthase [Candidatus Marinamargulisbacteria bacterium SCGC AG-414-C22]